MTLVVDVLFCFVLLLTQQDRNLAGRELMGLLPKFQEKALENT